MTNIITQTDKIVEALEQEKRALPLNQIINIVDENHPGTWKNIKDYRSTIRVIFNRVGEDKRLCQIHRRSLKKLDLCDKHNLICLSKWNKKCMKFATGKNIELLKTRKSKMKTAPIPETLTTGDNLDAMRSLNDSCIDLIYIDPPYNSGVDYKGERGEFKDTWKLSDIKENDFEDIKKNNPAVLQVIEFASNGINDDSMKAYLVFMAIRLMEMHRILKDTGSIYLHVDSTSSHYLKLIMDAIFTRKMFRREIIWANGDNSGFKGNANNWVRGSDTILYYTKTKNFTFNKQYSPRQSQSIRGYNKIDENGRFKQYKNSDGSIRKCYFDESKGVPMSSVWNDINSFQTATNLAEFEDYPTQKPEKLLERIITASSNEGDLVFDPFMGSGTALVVARDLNRQWIGCDLNEASAKLVKERLENKTVEIQPSLWEGEIC